MHCCHYFVILISFVDYGMHEQSRHYQWNTKSISHPSIMDYHITNKLLPYHSVKYPLYALLLGVIYFWRMFVAFIC